MNPVHIAGQFFPPKQIVSVKPYGNGLVNNTYLLSTQQQRYILQRINSTVFCNPELIVSNIQILSAYLQNEVTEKPQLCIPHIIPTRQQQLLFCDEQHQYWRTLNFIENSKSYETLQNWQQAVETGRILGHFHRLTHKLNPTMLYDTLPGFHITPSYLQQFTQLSIPLDKKNSCQDCIDFIHRRQNLASILESAKQRGELVPHTIHGDPKLNNILFDNETDLAISMIDLDTVKSGLWHYDIGDCIRSSCNTADNLSDQAYFEIDLCEVILDNYLKEMATIFTDHDFNYIYDCIGVITFELGIRFLTDYLNGDIYFKTTNPQQNLQRCRQQFDLLKKIQHHERRIKLLVNDLKQKHHH